jgi:integrase
VRAGFAWQSGAVHCDRRDDAAPTAFFFFVVRISTPSSPVNQPNNKRRRRVVKQYKQRSRRVAGVSQIGPDLYLIRAQLTNPRTGDPKDLRKRVTCASFADALRARAEMIAAFKTGAGPATRVRLDEYADQWMIGKAPTLKPSTRRTYADVLDDHILPVLGRHYMDALRPDDVRHWFAAKAARYASATANGFLRVLKTVMADAAEELEIRNPTARIRAIPEERSRRSRQYNMLSADEMGRFLSVLCDVYPKWYAFAFTQFVTATRFGEVSALRWEDIDEARGVIVIRRSHWRTKIGTTKTGSEKEVVLTEELRDVLRDWRQTLLRKQHRHVHTGWVFPSRVGKPHHAASCMRKAFVDVLKRIEVKRGFSSHGLRRTANDLLRRVATGEVTRAITGHMTVAMTDRYSHVDLSEKRAAATSMLRLVRSTPSAADGAEAIPPQEKPGSSVDE